MDKQLGMMQEGMLKMPKIVEAKNPHERERLAPAHRAVLRQH